MVIPFLFPFKLDVLMYNVPIKLKEDIEMSFEEKFDATKDKLAGEAKKAEGEAKKVAADAKDAAKDVADKAKESFKK